ncbi:transposase [bacterium]|nr:transposase [bacterium]
MPAHFKVYDGHYPHFVTSATIHWIPAFRRDYYFRVMTDSLGYCIKCRGLILHAYVIMPDHFHLICTQTDGDLPQLLGNIKGYTAHLVAEKIRQEDRSSWVRAIERAGGVWQDGYHPEQIHSIKFCEQKMRYMHDNPVRAGFVTNPCDWKYSSAGFYYEDRASIQPLEVIDW